MATERENCIDNIAKRLGREKGFVEEVLSDLDERADRKAGAGGDRRKALNDAGQEMLDQMGIEAAAFKRAEMMDAQLLAAKNRQARKLLKDGVKGHMILAAEINGVNAHFEGSRDSTWAEAFDYLVMYQLLEWINPGYINRMESRMRRQQGIEFMLSPSAAVGR